MEVPSKADVMTASPASASREPVTARRAAPTGGRLPDPAEMVDGLRRWRAAAPSYAVATAVVGALMLASGIVHLVIFAAAFVTEGASWWGDVSWRKPATFGLSFGATLLSTAWLLGRVRRRPLLGWALAGPLTAATVLEVGAVAMQQWRGVPSHFNTTTTFDAAVFNTMGVSIAIIGVASVGTLVWAAVGLRRDRAAWWAAVVGLTLVGAASAVGGDMIARGLAASVDGGPPPSLLIGPAGSAKLAHAVALHGFQVLPLLVVALEAVRTPADVRDRRVRGAAVAYATLFAAVMVQVSAGRALFDLTPVAGVAIVAGLAGMAWGAAPALAALAGPAARRRAGVAGATGTGTPAHPRGTLRR